MLIGGWVRRYETEYVYIYIYIYIYIRIGMC